MDYTKLWFEISLDPVGIGYAGKTDVQIVVLLNTTLRNVDRAIIEAYEMIEATVPAEFATLTAVEKQRYQIITGAGTVNIRGPNIRAAIGAMFGAGTQTRANLVALQTESMSRAAELGLGQVYSGHIGKARLVGATYK